MKSDFLAIMTERGFIHQCTDIKALDQQLTQQTCAAYIGFDATAPSLHVGSLVQIMMLRWLQKTGHRPIVLMGGGTSKVGDPSFKDEARQLINDTQIAENIAGISQVFKKFLTFGDRATDAKMLNNSDWLDGIDYLDFLRDYGRFFSINRMLSFESVKRRLDREQSLSFLEFNYMILQAYDFLMIHRHHDCLVQMGGSDQWGNIINGVELTRKCDQKEVFGLTSPLITTASGVKMGKTVNGAVWLNAAQLPAYEYWQFWRNTEDADVGKYLRLFTEIPIAEINLLEKLQGSEINHAKKILADAATTLAHGPESLSEIHTTVAKIFENQSGGDFSSLPAITITAEELKNGFALIEALQQLHFASSKGEARRLIEGNGVRINDTPISDQAFIISPENMNDQGVIKISAGKKRHGIIQVTDI